MQGFSLTKLWKNVLEDTMKAHCQYHMSRGVFRDMTPDKKHLFANFLEQIKFLKNTGQLY